MSMWSETVPPIRALGGPWGQEELQDLAGNMWNAFSYTRAKMAAVGGGGLEVGSGVQSSEGKEAGRGRGRGARVGPQVITGQMCHGIGMPSELF